MADGKLTSSKDNSSSDEIWVTEFNEKASQQFREKVLKLSAECHREPIVVYIDSYGGYVDSLAKMIETLDEIPNPVVTVCMGKAMSCGAILLSHGNIRYCGKHSRVMVHEVSAGAIGDIHDCHNNTKEGIRLNKYFLGLLAKNCGIKGGYEGLRKIIKERDGREIWMDAKGAMEFGLVDKVGLPRVNSVTLYEVADVPNKKIEISGVERSKHKKTPRSTKKKRTRRKKS